VKFWVSPGGERQVAARRLAKQLEYFLNLMALVHCLVDWQVSHQVDVGLHCLQLLALELVLELVLELALELAL
jgi:hypothetical protein